MKNRLRFVVYVGVADGEDAMERRVFLQEINEGADTFSQRICDYVENQAEILSVEEDE